MATKVIIDRPSRSFTTQTRALSPRYQGATSPEIFTKSWVCDRSISGTTNPKYKEEIALLRNASTPYTTFGKTVKGGTNARYSVVCQFKDSVTPDFEIVHVGWPFSSFGQTIPALPDATSIRGAAVAKFYSELAETISRFKGIVFLAELRQSVDTVGSVLSLAVKMLKVLWLDLRHLWRSAKKALSRLKSRKERRRFLASTLRQASGRYLEFVFGVQPLLQDLEDLVAVICKPHTDVVRLRKVASGKTVTTSVSSYGYTWNLIFVDWTISTSYTVKAVAVGAVDLSKGPTPNPLVGQAASLGFSLKEVVPALWELTPFSFLIDYFVNIGDLINAACYADIKLIYSDVSTLSKAKTEYVPGLSRRGKDTQTYKVVGWASSPKTVELQSWAFERVHFDAGFSSLHVSLPTSGKRIANMLALFTHWVASQRGKPL